MDAKAVLKFVKENDIKFVDFKWTSPGALSAGGHQKRPFDTRSKIGALSTQAGAQPGTSQYPQADLPLFHQSQRHSILISSQETLGAIYRIEHPESIPLHSLASIDPLTHLSTCHPGLERLQMLRNGFERFPALWSLQPSR